MSWNKSSPTNPTKESIATRPCCSSASRTYLISASFKSLVKLEFVDYNNIVTKSKTQNQCIYVQHINILHKLFNKYYKYRELSNAYNLSNKMSAFTERPNITFSNKRVQYYSYTSVHLTSDCQRCWILPFPYVLFVYITYTLLIQFNEVKKFSYLIWPFDLL